MATLEDLKIFIRKQNWTFAKTMPEHPHWYVVRKDCDDDIFVEFARYIRERGELRLFGEKREFVYLDIDGYSYWTMGNPLDETTIINRAAITVEPAYKGSP